jgi:hypothetical protein
VLKELYFTLADEDGGNADENTERVLTVLDAITLDEATKDGEVIVDIEDFKIILPATPYNRVQIHANAGDAKIEFSHKGVSNVDGENNIFSPAAGGYTKIVVTGNNWHPRQYTITYIDQDTAGGAEANKEGATLTCVTVTRITPEQPDLTLTLKDGVFENGTNSDVVNLSAGTTSVTVTAEPEAGGSVTYSVQSPITLTVGGVTAMYIYAAKEGKSRSIYTLLFSVPAQGQNIQPSIIVVPFKTMYKTGERINSSVDLAVYLRKEDGVTEKVSSGFRGIPAAAFTAEEMREITVTYTYAQTSLSAKYTVWVSDTSVIPSIKIIGYDVSSIVELELEYVDGGVLTLARESVSGTTYTYSAGRGTLAGGVIRSVKIGANTILLGRKDSDGVITLKLDGTGALEFRDADDAGYVPVGTYAEFQLINTALDGNYKQEADLDLLGAADYYGGPENWVPFGDGGTEFSGEFDGKGYTVDNLYISRPTTFYQGLFGFVGTTGVLKNIHIASGSVSGRHIVGGIVGINLGTITACSNTGSISGRNGVGGVAGVNEGTITACYNTGTVSGSTDTGGVAGLVTGTVTACYNTGTVSGSAETGGVAGVNEGTVTACYWDNSVVGSPPNGIGDPASDIDAEPFSGTADFPNVSGGNVEWGTGDGSGSGKYWKAGTTSGGRLPKLWFE